MPRNLKRYFDLFAYEDDDLLNIRTASLKTYPYVCIKYLQELEDKEELLKRAKSVFFERIQGESKKSSMYNFGTREIENIVLVKNLISLSFLPGSERSLKFLMELDRLASD